MREGESNKKEKRRGQRREGEGRKGLGKKRGRKKCGGGENRKEEGERKRLVQV